MTGKLAPAPSSEADAFHPSIGQKSKSLAMLQDKGGVYKSLQQGPTQDLLEPETGCHVLPLFNWGCANFCYSHSLGRTRKRGVEHKRVIRREESGSSPPLSSSPHCFSIALFLIQRVGGGGINRSECPPSPTAT